MVCTDVSRSVLCVSESVQMYLCFYLYLHLFIYVTGIQKSGIVQRGGRFAQAAYRWRLAASLDLKTAGVEEWTTVLLSWFYSLLVVVNKEGFSLLLLLLLQLLLLLMVVVVVVVVCSTSRYSVGFNVPSCVATDDVGADKVVISYKTCRWQCEKAFVVLSAVVSFAPKVAVDLYS